MNNLPSELQPERIAEAQARIRASIHRTPVFHSELLDQHLGAEIWLKAECFQRGGAFKIRGASNTIAQLSQDERRRGVITHSSGNHAQGVALAARALGVPATVVMPNDAPAQKRSATEAYGATIVRCEGVDREKVCAALMAEQGQTLVHPYDDPRIIAGQGTAAAELLEDHPELELLLVPVGGGGLISGSCLAAQASTLPNRLRPKVYGAEPAIADDARQSLAQGRVVTLAEVPRTLADGLRTRHIGEHNLAVMRTYVEEILCVSEAEIIEALELIWSRTKLLIEPSSAVPIAALLKRPAFAKGKKIGVILSGGNVDPRTLPPSTHSSSDA